MIMMNDKLDDKRMFSLYMAAVMQTLDEFERLHMTSWMVKHTPETFDDLDQNIKRLYDITSDDYEQFVQQVVDFHDGLEEEQKIQDWMASE